MSKPITPIPDFGGLFEMLVRSSSRFVNEIEERKTKHTPGIRWPSDGGYPAVPLSYQSFVHDMGQAVQAISPVGKIAGCNFLDVGCGIGDKVMMASSIWGFQSYGIELRDAVASFAETLMGQNSIIKKDALKFRDYDQFDVIYFYRPLWNENLQKKLELRIMKRAKPGAVLVAVFSDINPAEAKKYSWKHLTGSVWQKQ